MDKASEAAMLNEKLRMRLDGVEVVGPTITVVHSTVTYLCLTLCHQQVFFLTFYLL